MSAPIRYAPSGFLSSMPPSCQRPTLPLSKLPFLTPSQPWSRSSFPSSAFGDKKGCIFNGDEGREGMVKGEKKRKGEIEKGREIMLYSLNPYPLLFLAALPGAETVRSILGPIAELVKAWNLPEWLVHWGHPGNMAVVLFAMGGYGSYLGFRIRLSKDVEEKAMAKDLHPKLLAGMFFFFALGALGGIISFLTSNKPILESPHAVSGLMGLSLLAVQTISPVLFEEYPGMRTVHGLLGSSIMTLFLLHTALGLQLGLSF